LKEFEIERDNFSNDFLLISNEKILRMKLIEKKQLESMISGGRARGTP
jgi:hypothetical protein